MNGLRCHYWILWKWSGMRRKPAEQNFFRNKRCCSNISLLFLPLQGLACYRVEIGRNKTSSIKNVPTSFILERSLVTECWLQVEKCLNSWLYVKKYIASNEYYQLYLFLWLQIILVLRILLIFSLFTIVNSLGVSVFRNFC